MIISRLTVDGVLRTELLVECAVVDMEGFGKRIIKSHTRRYEDL